MAKLSLWQKNKGKDFNFQDTIAKESFYVGSLGIYIHLYQGVIDQETIGDPSRPSEATSDNWGISTIQDLTLLENRNHKYSDDVFELRGHFNEADKDFDLLQFNLALANGTKFVTFHLNDMIDKIGRKLMAGDVLEMPNLRDDALLDENAKAINQWYVITDASWPSEGFSSTWYPHFWRVRAEPMLDAPEYEDITRRESSDSLLDLLAGYSYDMQSTEETDNAINQAVLDKANIDVPHRNFDVSKLYVVDGTEFGGSYPWIWAGDGIPPNHSTKADAGSSYPEAPTDGDYFLRTDYEPARLFQYQVDKWRFVEFDYQKSWETAHRILETFINNDTTFTDSDGSSVEERQPITKVVKPKADL